MQVLVSSLGEQRIKSLAMGTMYKTKLILLMYATSCSYREVDRLRFGDDDYRCAADGFCLIATGSHSLQAGMRRGMAELRVDVLDAQTQYGHSSQNYAVRVTDQHANPLMLSDNGRIPKAWKVSLQDCHMLKYIAEFVAEGDVRGEMLQRLAKEFDLRRDAADIGRRDAFLLARQIVVDMAEAHDNVRRGGADMVPKRRKKQGGEE